MMAEENQNPKPYIILPHFIYKSDMGCVGQRICGIIYGLSSDHGYCTAKDAYMGDLLGMKPTAVRRQVQQLIKDNYVRNIGSSQHRKLVLNYIENDVHETLFGRSSQTRKNFAQEDETRKNFAQTRKNFAYLPIIYKINTNTGHFGSNDLSAIDDAKAFELLFSHFWNTYDNKHKKQETIKMFSKLSAADMEELILTLPYINQYHDRTDKTSFVPSKSHPTTFLRGRMWEDDVYQELKKSRKKAAVSGFAQGEAAGDAAEFEAMVKRFRRLSDGEHVQMGAADAAAIALLGFDDFEEAKHWINDYTLSVFRENLAGVWEEIQRNAA